MPLNQLTMPTSFSTARQVGKLKRIRGSVGLVILQMGTKRFSYQLTEADGSKTRRFSKQYYDTCFEATFYGVLDVIQTEEWRKSITRR